MEANKIILNDEVLIDLSEDTATEEDVLEGKTFHKADGTQAIGTCNLEGYFDGSATEITLRNIESIADYAFYYNQNIQNVIMPKVKTIGRHAFQNCNKLALTSLPDDLTSIGGGAFQYCYSLALTSLPHGLTSIGSYAFESCYNLALASLPDGLTSIGERTFMNCYELALTFLPDGLTSIGEYAFNHCGKLALTFLPHGLTSIDQYAFQNCNIKTITFMGTPDSIASYAFRDNNNLTIINVPWAEGEVANAPWGATNATINYNYSGVEISGKWTMEFGAYLYTGQTFYVNFTSNGEKFIGMYDNNDGCVRYIREGGDELPIYAGYWASGEEYSFIDFGDISQVIDSVSYDWFYNNGMQGWIEKPKLEGTYTLANYIVSVGDTGGWDYNSHEYYFPFRTGTGGSFCKISVSDMGELFYDSTLVADLMQCTWVSDDYRTITFDKPTIVDEWLYNFVTINADTTTYTISGKWHFNDSVDNYWNGMTHNVNFTSRGQSFTSMTRDSGWAIFYDSTFVYTGNWFDTSQTHPEYKNIDFGDTPQTVDKAFYVWFTTNATPGEEVLPTVKGKYKLVPKSGNFTPLSNVYVEFYDENGTLYYWFRVDTSGDVWFENTGGPQQHYNSNTGEWLISDTIDFGDSVTYINRGFASWLSNNATPIENNIYKLEGTYLLANELSGWNGERHEYNITFRTGLGDAFNKIIFDDVTGNIYYDDTVAYGTSWQGQDFRTLVFENPQDVDEFLFNFLTTNSAIDIDGQWRLNNVLVVPDGYTVYDQVYFTILDESETEFTRIILETGDTMHYGNASGDTMVYSNSWEDELYQYITFDGIQKVSRIFYDWFTANAVKQ